MNPYMAQLKKELTDYTAKCGSDRAVSILDTLWYCYSSANPIDDGKIRQSEEVLAPVFEELSVDSSNALFDLITDLLNTYQRAAFLEGMQVGVQLFTQLSGI